MLYSLSEWVTEMSIDCTKASDKLCSWNWKAHKNNERYFLEIGYGSKWLKRGITKEVVLLKQKL